jgi:hypothetical protein
VSDIQDLIHKTSIDCIERGKITERKRIIKLLESELGDMKPIGSHSVGVYDGISHAIEVISEETR